jgi:hypothetical protein
VLAGLLQCSSATAQSTPNNGTFDLLVSLSSATMHVDDELVADVVLSNPTDKVVTAGQGSGGLALELVNDKGVDVGRHAMGNYREGEDENPIGLGPTQLSLRPGFKRKFAFRWKPAPGYVTPGRYKLRVYLRDIGAAAWIYSNAVVLTVVP